MTSKDKEMRGSRAGAGAAASERFASVLRTVPVEETAKTGLRDSRRARIRGGERLHWTATFESEWHRHIAKTLKASTIH